MSLPCATSELGLIPNPLESAVVQTGSPAAQRIARRYERRGAVWAAEQFRSAGIRDVQVQPFAQEPSASFWMPLAWEVRLLADPVRLPVRSRPVSLRINSVRNDDADNVAPLADAAPAQGSLF